MRIKYVAALLVSVCFSQISFANQAMMGTNSTACAAIADACSAAGFVRDETANQKIWQDCMRPIILGQSVNNVKMDAKVVKTCRADKITEMKSELATMEHAAGKK